MNINEVYKLVSYLVDKYQGTYIAPDEFNQVINMAQQQYISSLTEGTGTPNRNPRTPTGLSTSAVVAEKLSSFLVESNLSITSQLADKPANLFKTVALRTTDDDYGIRYVNEDKVASFIGNAIDPPTVTNPIYYEIGSKYKFYPSALSTAKLTYISTPPVLKWAYTGALVYDPVNSVPANDASLQWSDEDVNEIIYRAIGIIGINLKDGDLVRAAQMVKNDGQ